MAEIPKQSHSTANLIFRSYELDADNGNRPHLGASLIGHHCERYLWLVFRHAAKSSFSGRMLRLFDTGKREEARICKDLERIGCEVHADDGTGQYRVSTLGGHFGGSMDAVIKNYHEAPKQWFVVEMKTHSDKSFKELSQKGVEEAKPQHFAQMQTYMGLSGMDRALYFAVNKNTDEIYTQTVKLDEDKFSKLTERASRVINANEPPLRCSNDPSWYQCKYCDMHAICHATQMPEVNCRTCAHSTPDTVDGGWMCEKKIWPMVACKEHRYIPVLLENFADVIDANEDGNWVKYRHKTTGNEFYNGDLSSLEIRACQDKSMLGDDSVQEFRHSLGADVVA